ncbi:MAG: AZOBR_p60025 family cell surface glycopolymer formation protein [cyanobacterium endosymbiont of Rhopalodia sterrenbergii]
MKYFLTKFSPKVINLLIAIIVLTAVLLYLYLIRFQGNITGFFRIGSILELSPFLNPETTKIYQGEIGYDGQQFLSIALDPFLQNSETITTLDHPIYRYRRILYPLISYLFSFGNRTLIPHIMVAINYLSIIGIIWIISLYFQLNQEKKWQPLLMLFIPGVWIVFSLGTADLLSSLLLILSFYCYRYNKPIWTAITISLACLTRETLLPIWLAILLTSIIQNKKEQSKQLLWAWIPPFLWTLYINSLHLPGAVRVKANFGYPFMGIYNKFISLSMGGFKGENLFEAYSFILIIVIFITIFIISSSNRKDNQLIQLSTLIYSAMFIISSMTILSYYLDYSRVFIDVYFFLLLSINTNKIPIKSILFLALGLESFAFLALHS